MNAKNPLILIPQNRFDCVSAPRYFRDQPSNQTLQTDGATFDARYPAHVHHSEYAAVDAPSLAASS